MSKLLEGRVVIVTGAGGAIGSNIAKLAASHGAKVVVNDLGGSEGGEGASTAPAQLVADEINASGGEALANFGSVADWDDAHALIRQALDAWGRIDVVVNNAGILRDTIFHKMEPKDWHLVEQVNLTGSFNVSRAAAPHLKDQGGGCFVHMTSTSGLIGNIAQVNYGAAKLGVAGLSKCIAIDMERFGVRSNCIAPFAYTRMVATIPQTDANEERLRIVKQMGPEKIAPFVVSLMTDEAKDVTAQIFGVRKNEIVLFSQPRPIRSVHTNEGWTVESCLETALPALRPSLYRLERSPDVFSWDPI
ncbi:MAG: SDR family NAD(P)-dependent oxidoreductase [Sphingomonadales bacterium]